MVNVTINLQLALDTYSGCKTHVAGGLILRFTTPPHATNNRISFAIFLSTDKIS